MSRIGKRPIEVPSSVTVTVEEGNLVKVKGPKGELAQKINEDMIIEKDGNVISVKRPSDTKQYMSLHGLSRSLIFNMVYGVTTGYTKVLEIVGVGYRATKQGNKLVLNIGYSHPVEIPEKPGITIDVPAPNRIEVKGYNKQQVCELAANIRKVRQPEPYKGKGIRYEGEQVRRKVGKTGK